MVIIEPKHGMMRQDHIVVKPCSPKLELTKKSRSLIKMSKLIV